MVSILNAVLGSVLIALLFFTKGLGTAYLVLSQAASAVVSIFVQPIQYGALTLLYYDLRVRKEAFDLEMAARSLEVPSPT
jgi:hypothetical protein